MTDLDFSRCTIPPYDHQKIGVQKLFEHKYFALFDEMGNGKTAQAIIAAQFLYINNFISRVIVIAPSSVRGVWFDQELGELKKHLWDNVPSRVSEYHKKIRQWRTYDKNAVIEDDLKWIITNYDWIRAKVRAKKILSFCTPRTLLILDESSAVKSPTSSQTRVCKRLRASCGRVILLNGTPIANTPMDMFSQGNIMHSSILDCQYISQYRGRYAIMAKHERFPQIVGWKNLEDLQQRFAPYVLRRLKKDCLDLPEKLPSVAHYTPLIDTWPTYKNMRDDLVAWLSEQHASVASQAAIKVMRLAQITSGFIAGIESIHPEEDDAPPAPLQFIGREKLDLVLNLIGQFLIADPNIKILVWVRFRAELERLVTEIIEEYPQVIVGSLHGGQSRLSRDEGLRLLDPRTAPSGPVVVAGTYGTGSLGLNLTACHTVINMSIDFSLYKFLQSADRVHRPGQVHPVSYYDIIATGPDGQKTIDHIIIKALRNKQDIADWTARAWLDVLKEGLDLPFTNPE